MNIVQAYEATVAAAAKVKAEVEAFFTNNPELGPVVAREGDAALKGALGELTSVTESEVEKIAPAEAPSIDSLIAGASAKIDADLAAGIADLTAQADAKKAALSSAQASLATA